MHKSLYIPMNKELKLLEKMLSSKTRARILLFFLTKDDANYYQAQVLEFLNCSLSVLQYELENLVKLGLLKKINGRKNTFYRFNKDHIFYHDLKSLVEKCIT